MPKMRFMTTNYLENVYQNSLYGQDLGTVFDYGRRWPSWTFRYKLCFFLYFFFYGPEGLLYQRGHLHRDLSTCPYSLKYFDIKTFSNILFHGFLAIRRAIITLNETIVLFC